MVTSKVSPLSQDQSIWVSQVFVVPTPGEPIERKLITIQGNLS